MDTSGFYKLDPDAAEPQMFWAPNFVYAPEYTLLRENQSTYTFPIDGWYWFESVGLAREFWSIPEPVVE